MIHKDAHSKWGRCDNKKRKTEDNEWMGNRGKHT